MIKRSTVMAGLGLLAIGCMAAPAAAQYVPDQVIAAVDLEKLQSVVKSLDHEVLSVGEGGAIALTATSDGGLIYSLTGTACEAGGVPGCQGVMMQVQYGVPDTASYRTLAEANLQQAAVNSWMDPANGVVGFTRYVVLDKGVTMANLRENILVLLAIAPNALETVKGNQE